MPRPLLEAQTIGLEDLQRKLKPGQLTGPPLRQVLTAASANAKKVAARGVGGTAARSIMSEVKPTSARVFSLMSPARSTSIEFGRPAGGPLLHSDALLRWIRRVGYAFSPFVLAREIQRRGVKGRFFMAAAKRNTEQMLPGLLRKMSDQVESRLVPAAP